MTAADAWRSYEDWRGLWLSGRDSCGIQALRFHGLRVAVELAGVRDASPTHAGPRRPASLPAGGLLIGDAALAEATRQVRHLLGAGSLAGSGGDRTRAHS